MDGEGGGGEGGGGGGGHAEVEVRLVAGHGVHAVGGGGASDGLRLASCLDHQVLVVLVALQLPRGEVLYDVRGHGGRGAVRRVAVVAGAAVRRAARAAGRPPPPPPLRTTLFRWLAGFTVMMRL